MTFYHFTSPIHLPLILEVGYLKVCESNIDMLQPHAGPDVVWLLDTPDATGESNLFNGLTNVKTLVRFEVDVPAIKWTHWPPIRWMDPDWRDTLTSVGGSDHWYVWPARIPRRRWISIAQRNQNSYKWHVHDHT